MIKETDMVKRCVCMERESGGGGGVLSHSASK